jgi:rhamnose utilization protein RhaD (predicted bifunctional aldolase and dehydrogenase)
MPIALSRTDLALQHLEDRWDDKLAAAMDQPELLRYRSNLLGSDLRITNFGGGNTSSKVTMPDPLTGQGVSVLWVKGSGGDLGSIQRAGFATLYMEKLLALDALYRGVEHEDAMADYYPLCTFGINPVAASIDTPLHGFLPFPHVDHLHPDCAIALAAAANGHEKMAEFNQQYDHRLIWVPWQRPGFELGMMMKRAVAANPGCDGILLGGHGLFTWGQTQRECYLHTIRIIDQLTSFIEAHAAQKGSSILGGQQQQPLADRRSIALQILPFLRGAVSEQRRLIGSYSDLPDVLEFVNSRDAEKLAYMGTSCPDHFIRTKIRPMYVPWDTASGVPGLQQAITTRLAIYRSEYTAYYRTHALPGSPAIRDTNPAVVLIPGLGMFTFGKSKPESRIVGEFYVNAIHVIRGAAALEGSAAALESSAAALAGRAAPGRLPQCAAELAADAPAAQFQLHSNYVSLPPSEAFRIEYWALEDAKLRRQPPEKELSRHVVLVMGGGSSVAREVALLAAERGAHLVIADRDPNSAARLHQEVQALAGKESSVTSAIDIRSAVQQAIATFGGLDILIHTVAATATMDEPLVAEATRLFAVQALGGSIVLTSSANVSPGIRELATAHAPQVRINDVEPIQTSADKSINARNTAEAILFLAGPKASSTTGLLFPVGA